MLIARIEVKPSEMEEDAVAECLEVAMSTALDSHGLNAGVEAEPL